MARIRRPDEPMDAPAGRLILEVLEKILLYEPDSLSKIAHFRGSADV